METINHRTMEQCHESFRVMEEQSKLKERSNKAALRTIEYNTMRLDYYTQHYGDRAARKIIDLENEVRRLEAMLKP